MKVQKPSFNNCLIGLAYLTLMGRISDVVIVTSPSTVVPYHFLGQNQKGQILHFMRTLDHINNPWAPLWFLGTFQGIAKKHQKEQLLKNKREVLTILKFPWSYLFTMGTCAILFIPWMTGWALIQWVYFFKGLYLGITNHRFVRWLFVKVSKALSLRKQ